MLDNARVHDAVALTLLRAVAAAFTVGGATAATSAAIVWQLSAWFALVHRDGVASS